MAINTLVPKSGKRLVDAIAWRIRYFYERLLYRVTRWHRRRLVNTVFVGITGSAGKTTAKDLVAGILQKHFAKPGRKTIGTLNSIEYVPALILGTRRNDMFCVAEVSAPRPGAMDLQLDLVRPSIGVITNVASDHFSAYKGQDGIALEKGKLIAQLPPDGVAVLNFDEPLVMGMAERFSGRIVTYGVTDGAMLRASSMESAWPKRLSLNVEWQGEVTQVQTLLCGTHWVNAVLAAIAASLAIGVPMKTIVAALAEISPFEGRLEPVSINGITFLRDDWKAPLSTIPPAFDVMRQARADRKIIVIGTVSDYPGDSARRYVKLAKEALNIAECVVFVGPWASAALKAKRDESQNLFAFTSIRDASSFFATYLKSGDLVLLKGSAKADHLQRIILAMNGGVQCWQPACQRNQFCDACDLLRVPSGLEPSKPVNVIPAEAIKDAAARTPALPTSSTASFTVVGLGNPEEKFADTPHNVGYRTVEQLALKIGQPWQTHDGLALVAKGELNGVAVCLVKPLSNMNEIGPTLRRFAEQISLDVEKCILVHDDVDLPFATLRTRQRGGDGGHRGVRSVVQTFQDDRFRRVKIGVGQAAEGQSVIDFVLAPFPAAQASAVESMHQAAAAKVMELIRQEVAARA